jgi:hypothetical protein
MSVDEASNIKTLKQSFRFLYLFDFIGVFYAFKKKFYLFGFILLIIHFASLIIAEFWSEILLLKFSLNFLVAMFGLEIEEFFAKRQGLKLQGFVFGRNEKEVQNEIEGILKIKFYSKSRLKSFINKIKKGFERFARKNV